MKGASLKLLKTHGEKMSAFGLSIMLMKTNGLNHSLHDVDENKGDRTEEASPIGSPPALPGDIYCCVSKIRLP
jgi:hypothetical protein